ncbi:MAG: hypothetical protein ACRDWH_04515 [Acidimicrobiia bacterium]
MEDTSPTVKWARLGWLACMALFTVAAFVGFGVIHRMPEVVSAPSFLEAMDQLGISPVWAAWVGFVLPTAVAFGVAIIVRRGRPNDPAALLFGIALVGLCLLLAGVGTALTTVWPMSLARSVDVVAMMAMAFGLYLFPNGRFVPSWTRWPAFGLALLSVALPQTGAVARAIGTGTADGHSPAVRNLVAVVAVVTFGTWFGAQVYRYRRRSTMLERLQSRWVLFGFALVILGTAGAIVARSIGVSAGRAAWLLLVAAVGSLILPVAVGFAILRYRLYEINRIISRTVTYTVVAILLAVLYSGAVFALSRLVPLTGDLAVAGSTLAVAALFNPLRRGVQEIVDRRFNRPRYDAALMIDSFAGRLRANTQLSEVLADLQTVVVNTVEPRSATVWLRVDPRTQGL